jgi:hypothetical protein
VTFPPVIRPRSIPDGTSGPRRLASSLS